MQTEKADEIKIINTTTEDWDDILLLFEQVIELQGKNGYQVWESIDQTGLVKEIENKLQYKVVKDNDILCIFSIQYRDPFIWRERDKNDAVYLHRIVANPKFKGQKQFQTVLNWARQFARTHEFRFIRMDTWAENTKIIAYYRSFGFEFIENYQTSDAPQLPKQNRNLNVALLELKLNNNR
jgi:ribosomal protein S18 acetylase RimI-like enzyme